MTTPTGADELGVRDPLAGTRRLRAVFWAIGLVLAVLHAWERRHFLNVDGVSYLDVADAYFAGDWQGAITGHWSPLYSWVLGLGLAVIRPSAYWEFATVQLLNVGIFIVTFVAFDFFLRELVRSQQEASRSQADAVVTLPPWGWVALGYPLFLWSSLHLVTVWIVTPDMMVAAVVYTAMALVLRIWRQPRVGRFVTLGAILGLGYLTKAPMFPLAFVFLGTAALSARANRGAMLRLAGAGIVALLVIGGPFIAALSANKGRLTFGDSRVVAYAWLIDQVPFRNWQGGAEAGGRLIHPTRQISENPAAYEFGTPLRGTYPVWYDPSYWYDGIQPTFRLGAHVRTLIGSAREFHAMFLGYAQSGLVVLFGVCLFVGWRTRGRSWVLWVVLAPAVAGLGLYSVVLVLPRYVGPFIALGWLGAFAWVRLPPGRTSERLVSSACAAAALMLLLATAVSAGPRAYKGFQELTQGERIPSEPFAVAEAVHALGIKSGEKVAIVYSPPETASVARLVNWARVARVRIVAEVPPEGSRAFWEADDTFVAALVERLRQVGVRAIVAMHVPTTGRPSRLEGWTRVEGTPFSVLVLR